MLRESATTDLERLKTSILSEAQAYGPVAKLILMPDSANRQTVCKMTCASSDYRTLVAGRHKGLVIGETVYFVIASAAAVQEAVVQSSTEPGIP